MASYDTGYDDERFLHPVGHTLHCSICTNVLKDPVMCGQNEHLFCRACITIHLMNSQTCPNCIEPLTIATLSQASRGIRSLLAELKIKCEFFDRGCGKFIELEHLGKHVADCGFALVVCSNEGCYLEVNKRDLLHHETAVCEFCRVQCHSCSDIRQEIAEIREKLDKNEEIKKSLNKVTKQVEVMAQTLDEDIERIDAVEENVVRKVEVVQGQLIKQEEMIGQLKADHLEMKKSLNEINKQLVQVQTGQKGIAEAYKTNPEPKLVIIGGESETGRVNSTELFRLSNRKWSLLQPLNNRRSRASTVIYENQVLVCGGYIFSGGNKSMEKISLNEFQVSHPVAWEDFPAELPSPLHGHCCVVYNERLIVTGGYDGDKKANSDDITEVSLVPPYTSKLLATMPQTRWYHGATLFDDKIIILGGIQGKHFATNLKSVLMFDITENKFHELAPLPYAVSGISAVKWGDDNVIIAGGVDKIGKALKKVLLYNIKSQKSHELPEMEYKRKGCVAAVVGDTIIVMGGKDENEKVLKSVEGFRFDRYSWQELPDMHEKRFVASAIVC